MFGIIASSGSTTAEPEPLKTLTYINSSDIYTTAVGQTQTLTYPSGTQEGDLLVLFRMYDSSLTAPQPTIPAAFTSIMSNTTSGLISARTAYRVVGSGVETGVSLTTDANMNSMSMLLAFRPNFAITSVTPTTETNTLSGNAVSISLTNGSTTSNPYLAFIHAVGSGTTPHTFSPLPTTLGMTEIDHSQNTSISRSLTVLYRRLNQGDTLPGTLSTTTSDAGTNIGQSFRLAIA